MTTRKIITLFVLFASLSSCSIKKKTINDFQQKISNVLSEEDLIKRKYIVVIPGAGCPGCVSEAEAFVKKINNKSEKVFIVFTTYHSKKILRLKLGIDLLKRDMHLDEVGIFNQGHTYSFYPTVYYLNNGKVVAFEYADPNNHDLFKEIINSLNID